MLSWLVRKFLLLCSIWICAFEVDAKYTLVLKVQQILFSSSRSVNYATFYGQISDSPQVNINVDKQGNLLTNLLQEGNIAIIKDKFPGEHGAIHSIKIGNKGDSLSLSSIVIMDLTRNRNYSLSLDVRTGLIKVNQSQTFHFKINGGWTEWSATWSVCSKTCEGGVQSRTRSCTNPRPQNQGSPCQGENEEKRACNTHACPVDGHWSKWTDWTTCSKVCGQDGVQMRLRTCTNPAPSQGGQPCADSPRETQPCNREACPQAKWADWAAWSDCDKQCGPNATRTRTRKCVVPENTQTPDAAICPGSNSQTEACQLSPCAVDGQWTLWTQWTKCKDTCGASTKKRTRTCTNPAPAYGGKSCPGDSEQTEDCPARNCQVNGEWTDWSDWSQCSQVCGTGTKPRTRSCSNPRPAFGGLDCPGSKIQTQSCQLNICPVDGDWSAWSPWSACSKACGTGQQHRIRSCSNPAPAHGGKMCAGKNKEEKNCNLIKCPVNGGWSKWSDWTNCSKSCGPYGYKTRQRLCNSPPPQNDGELCEACVTTANYHNSSGKSGAGSQNSSAVILQTAQNCTKHVASSVETEAIACNRDKICFENLDSFADKLFDNAMSSMNSENASDDEKLSKVFEILDELTNILDDQLKKGKKAVVQTQNLFLEVARMTNDKKQSLKLQSTKLGIINLETEPNNRQKVLDSISGQSGTTPSTSTSSKLEFSSLNSKEFFKNSPSSSVSAPVISLDIKSEASGQSDSSLNVNLAIDLPNQNPIQENALMRKVNISRKTAVIQHIPIASSKSAFQITAKIGNLLPVTLVLSDLNKMPNRTVDALGTVSLIRNHNFSESLASKSSNRQKFQLNITRSSKLKFYQSIKSEGTIQLFIPSNQLKRNSNLTLSILLAESLEVQHMSQNKQSATKNSTFIAQNKTYIIELGVASILPRVWNKKTLTWDDADAEIDETSDTNGIRFKSNFLGTFSAKIFVAPNTIDFANVFNNFSALLADSFVVLLVLIILLIGYLLFGIFMWKLDREEANLLRYEPIRDNDPRHDYSYVVNVFTSECSEAGTRAKVSINILGTWGKSGTRKLDDGWRKGTFDRGVSTNFVLATNASLGDLQAVRVFHDDTGPNPAWHLEKILIEDLQRKKLYVFMCDSWLASDRFDGKTERVLLEIKEDNQFQELFLQMKLSGVLNRHVMLTLLRKTGQSSYTRLQKLSVFVTMFFLVMVCNAMWFGKSNSLPTEANFEFDFGIFKITWFAVYSGLISIAITYPCVFICSEIFRRTKRWRRRWTEDEVSRMKSEMTLPRGFLVIGWLLLLGALIAAAFFTFLYSLEWGGEKSANWLKSFFLGILSMIILTDPLVLLIIYLIAKKIFAVKNEDEREIDLDLLINDDVKELLGADETKANEQEINKFKREKVVNKRMVSVITDATSYMVFILLLTAIAYDSRDQVTYQQTDMLKKTFMKDKNLNYFMDIYNWAKLVGVPNAYPYERYNSMNLTGDLINSIDVCNCMRQGPFRLRQIRVKKNGCRPASKFASNFRYRIACNQAYSKKSVETRHFKTASNWSIEVSSKSISSNKTKPLNRNAYKFNLKKSIAEAFEFQSEFKSGGFPFEGKFGMYEGGGYVANLGMNKNEADMIVDSLQKFAWIDRYTRAVFFEGTVYNWNTNLFSSIQILFEVPNSGGLFMYHYGIRSYNLYNYVGGKAIVLLTMQAAFVLIVLINIYREIRKMATSPKLSEYFADNWNLIELITILLSLIIISTTAVRIKLTIDAIEKMMNNRGVYVAFDDVSHWLEVTCIFMGISSFVAIFRVLKYLGFNKYISIMQSTIVYSLEQINSFFVVFACFFVAYLASGHALFALGEMLFSNLWIMARTLFGTFLGIITYDDMFSNVDIASQLYYYTWNTLSLFFLMSIFVSILNDTYSDVLHEQLFSYDAEMVDHAWSKLSKGLAALTNSVKEKLPSPPNKMATVAPADMMDKDTIDLSSIDLDLTANGGGSRVSLRDKEQRYKNINPQIKKCVAELNNDKLTKDELEAIDNSITWSRDGGNGTERVPEQVYISSSFTDIEAAMNAQNSQMNYSNFVDKLPRYRAHGNRNGSDEQRKQKSGQRENRSGGKSGQLEMNQMNSNRVFQLNTDAIWTTQAGIYNNNQKQRQRHRHHSNDGKRSKQSRIH